MINGAGPAERNMDHGAWLTMGATKKSLPNVVRETMVEGDLQPDYVCSQEHQGEN